MGNAFLKTDHGPDKVFVVLSQTGLLLTSFLDHILTSRGSLSQAWGADEVRAIYHWFHCHGRIVSFPPNLVLMSKQ